MSESIEGWFWVSWSVALACLILSICLRAWLVHVLTTRHPSLYTQLGSPAFFVSWSRESADLVRALKVAPSGTLSHSEVRVLNFVRMLHTVGQLSGLTIVGLVIAQALLT